MAPRNEVSKWTDEVHRTRYAATVTAVKRQRKLKSKVDDGLPKKNSGPFPLFAITAVACGLLFPPRGLLERFRILLQSSTAKRPPAVRSVGSTSSTKTSSHAAARQDILRSQSSAPKPPLAPRPAATAAATAAMTRATAVAAPTLAPAVQEEPSTSSSSSSSNNKKKNNNKKKGKKGKK